MSAQPAHDLRIDKLTAELLESVHELRAQLGGRVPGPITKLKAAVIRDLADDLHAAIEDLPQQRRQIIRHDSGIAQ